MADFNRCMDCMFSTWEMTKSGRLHPEGRGTCNWTKAVALPASMYEEDQARFRRELSQTRWISRRNPIARCDTYQPKGADQ
jgi:hypothetical protein